MWSEPVAKIPETDKALEEYLAGTYNKDEDIELLKLLAMIADINNEKVKKVTQGNQFFDDIRKEVTEFSADKEVQIMLLEEKMAIFDMQMTKAEGVQQGLQEGRTEIQDVYNWLFENGRDDDVKKATKDPAYYDNLLKEYINTKK